MFNPDDKNRTPRRRSLLDLVPEQEDARLSARANALRDELADREAGSRPRGGPQISLTKSDGKASGHRSAETFHHPEPELDGQAEAKPGWKQRISGWVSGAGSNDGPQQNSVQPLPRADAQPVRTLADDGSLNEDRPLIDLGLVMRSVWQVRFLILALMVIGAIGGVMLAMMTPNKYISESRLYADPREVRLTDSDLSNQALATEAILAIIDSQMQVLTSGKVLERVSAELGLERDPEFSGRGGGAGLGTIREMIFGRKAATATSNTTQIVLGKLRDAITVSRDEKTFIIALRVTTHDAAKSALIANKLVATFLEEESNAQSGFFKRTTTALDGRIAELRKDLDLAETAVEKYKADNDIIGASGKLISENQLVTLNDQVGAAGNRVAEARAKADTLAGVRLDDVLSGASPEDINSITLTELRKQYATARAEFGSLSTRLGPRHPQRVAAEQALASTRGEIQNELRRIAASAQTELQRAVDTQADLARQLAVQKARQVNSSTDFVKLRELERTANATRVIYESFLKRALETGEEQKLTSRNIRVISQAEPALQPSGPSRKIIAIGGLMAGLFGGIGIGVLLGMYKSLMGASRTAPATSDFVYEEEPTDQPPGGGTRASSHSAGEGSSREAPPAYRQNRTQGYAYADPATSEVERTHPVRREADVSARLQAYREWSEAAARAQSAKAADFEPQPAVPERQEGMRRVQDDLKSLRTRVETYARQNGRARS